MVQVAKNGNARVFVGSMVPTLANRQRSQNASQLEAYDDVLKVMCTQEGVTYVDLYNGLMPQADQLIGVDGLHPNESGYRRIAELFFNAIKNELRATLTDTVVNSWPRADSVSFKKSLGTLTIPRPAQSKDS